MENGPRIRFSSFQDEAEDEDKFDDEWTVPEVSLSEDDGAAPGSGRDGAETGREGAYRRHSEVISRNVSLPSALNRSLPNKILLQSCSNPPRDEGIRPTGAEYETLIIDLRDALRKRREAEESLEIKEVIYSPFKWWIFIIN